MSEDICQIQSVHRVSEGLVKLPLTYKDRINFFLLRWLKPKNVRKIKDFKRNLFHILKVGHPDTIPPKEMPAASYTKTMEWEREGVFGISIPTFQAGELVKVRTVEEIEATLDRWGKCKGCTFLSTMQEYCGTTQRVLKPLKRFVDERDYRVKTGRNTYILENVICQGEGFYGRCDRSCYFFWRAEWLEKINS